MNIHDKETIEVSQAGSGKGKQRPSKSHEQSVGGERIEAIEVSQAVGNTVSPSFLIAEFCKFTCLF